MSRSVLVVGANGGIGRACVAWFRDAGDHVWEFARSTDGDACDPAAVAHVVNAIPRLDVVVHAAGRAGNGGIDEHSVDDWRRIVDDNVTSAFVVTQATLPILNAGASMVFFSSVNARHGGNRHSGPAYAAAKAAIMGFSRYLAKDLAQRGIRVNTVAPGPVSTPMLGRLAAGDVENFRQQMPLGRITTAEEIAGTVGWLCSHSAASVTGAVVDVNGGLWMG